MAKIIKGAKRGKDPRINYAIINLPTSKYPVRRSADPENYLHSNSKRVRKVRETFAEAMITYSQLDIVTKQAYSEAIKWRTLSPLNPYLRRLVEIILKRIEEMPPPPPTPAPEYTLDISPFAQNQPQTTREQMRDLMLEWLRQYTPKKYYRQGPAQWIYDYMAQRQYRNPFRTPFPPEVPNPEQQPKEQQNPFKYATTIVVTIEPKGITGMAYEGYIWVKTEYQEIKMWISSNKKEVLIIVAIGAFILFGWELLVAGGLKSIGSTLFVKEAVATPELASALAILMIPWEPVKDYIEKKIILNWAEDISVSAYNASKAHWCYIEKTKEDNQIIHLIYEGSTEATKGKPAAKVILTVDYDQKTANTSFECLGTSDKIYIYVNGVLAHTCNPSGFFEGHPWLWNNTKKWCGVAKVSSELISGDEAAQYTGLTGEEYTQRRYIKMTWAWEDLIMNSDWDWDDAYIYAIFDAETLLPLAVWTEDGTRGDDLYLYWGDYLIAHYPARR